MKAKLIDKGSLLYKKRMVRELNAAVDGFYAPIATVRVRCNRARLRAGNIEVRSRLCAPMWFRPAYDQFDDAYGREVCASRKP